MSFLKPLSISLSPNTEKDDVLLAFKLLWQPWRWKKGKDIEILEEEFAKYLGVHPHTTTRTDFVNLGTKETLPSFGVGVKHAISFNSGRSSLMAILSVIKENSLLSFDKSQDEVLLQAFTCNAVPNPIIWSGLKPVYVDANENTFNISVEDLQRKITEKSRAVIVQHTFGLPADMDKIIEVCQKYNLVLIEDCAHSLGAVYNNKKVGTFGKVSFFSFSRDKVISSVYGGMVATNDPSLAEKIRQAQGKFGFPSYFWIFQQLLHPILMNWLILPTYRIFGKYLLMMLQWLHILSKAVHWKEKMGLIPGYFPKRLPNALAILALNQFQKLEIFNNHRKKIADFYRSELTNTSFGLPLDSEQIYLRFTIKHPRVHEIIRKAWQKNILIGDWYTTAIVPHDTRLEKMQYYIGSCPVAEKLAKITLNLPTHINISKTDAEKIVFFLKSNEKI
ncbi:MAG: aminotransferase class I/II-fold pyridoxal phosphate-dependent enzyme [Patescibacteria group bacterium]